ncbi:MAG: HAD-IA family hydrolase [Gammaproteobacteria bacterium]|nr:HAD-IA family hydrolase [Gammaproteobacteria bacterium]
MADYKLLVFDWDGTLMDSPARIVACFQAAAKQLQLAVPSAQAVRDIIGLGMRESVLSLYPTHSDPDIQRFVECYRHFDSGADTTPTPLFEGVKTMLEDFERRGYLLAVATSKGRRGLDRVLRETELQPVFHITRCIDEAQSKPHPQMLLDILAYTGVEATDALMIGDTEYDLLMARNAGVDGAGVACGAHPRDRLERCAPVVCLDHIVHFPGWLHAETNVN